MILKQSDLFIIINEITYNARELMLIGLGLKHYNYTIEMNNLDTRVTEFDKLSKDIFMEV